MQIPRVGTEIPAFTDPAAEADAAQGLPLVTGAGGDDDPLRLLRRFRDDVDDAVHRVRSPERRPRTADHLDPLDILEECVLPVPKHPGTRRLVNAPAIHQHQHFVAVLIVETACADRPNPTLDLTDLQAGNRAQ